MHPERRLSPMLFSAPQRRHPRSIDSQAHHQLSRSPNDPVSERNFRWTSLCISRKASTQAIPYRTKEWTIRSGARVCKFRLLEIAMRKPDATAPHSYSLCAPVPVLHDPECGCWTVHATVVTHWLIPKSGRVATRADRSQGNRSAGLDETRNRRPRPCAPWMRSRRKSQRPSQNRD